MRDDGRSRYFYYIAPFENRATLGFEYGVLLSNRESEDLRKQELTALIAEAAAVAATVRLGR